MSRADGPTGRDEIGAAALPPRSVDVVTRALRRLSISWRVSLVVVLNLLALLVLAVMLWGAGSDIEAAWSDLRGAHAATERLTELERAAYTLHREVKTFLDHPDEARRTIVEEAKSVFTRTLWRAQDETTAAAREDVRAFGEIARHYLFGFDDLRGLEIDIALLYDNEFADLESELRRDLDALDLAIRPGDAVLRPLVASAYDSFAELRIQLVSYRHERDHTMLKAARAARQMFMASLAEIGASPTPDSRGYAIELFQPQLAVMETLFDRLGDIADKQARWLAGLVEGNRTAMLGALATAVERQHQREETAIERFAELMRSAVGRFLTIAAVFLGLSLFMSLRVARSIRVPLADVQASMRAVVAGEHEAPVVGIDVADEIGATARSVELFRREVAGFRRREEELAAQERRWFSVLETSPIGIAVRSAVDGRRLFRNHRWNELFGADADDNLAMPGFDGFADLD